MRGYTDSLNAVRERLDRAAADQDPGSVLGDHAVADAGELAALAGPSADPDAAYVLGMFGWFRFEALADDAGRGWLIAATLFMVRVFAADPDAVPEPLVPWYQQAGSAEIDSAAGEAAGRAGDLFSAYPAAGQVSLLWEAVLLFRAAATATPAGHLDRAANLSGLGGALQKLAERTGDTSLLESAICAQRDAVAAAPPGHPGRPAVLANLGAALQKLAERTGATDPLREAVQACQDAVAAAPPGDRDRPVCLTNLGNALHILGRSTGDTRTLREAAGACRDAVSATPAGDPGQAGRLSNLGAVLESLFELTGSTTALQEAADSLRAAVAATPDGHPDRAGYLSNLGAVLQQLFDRTMETSYLAEAVRNHQEAADATPAGHPDKSRRLANLGTALRALAERTTDLTMLAEAATTQRDAVAATPGDHPDRGRYLSNLGNVLQVLAERTADPALLDEAVSTHRDAVAAAPAGHPDRAANLANLGGALQIQARLTRDPSAQGIMLGEAVQAGRDAIEVTPTGQREHAMYLDNLGNALQELSAATGDAGALGEAGRCFAEAAQDVNAPAAVRISVYRGLARLPGQAGMPAGEMLAAMETATQLLPQVAPPSLVRADRQYSLGRLASLAGLAAAAAVAAGNPGRAVELLEQTRGILAAGTIDARSSDLAALRRRNPGLAQAFQDLRARIDTLDHPGDPAAQAPDFIGDWPDPAQGRRDAQTDWQQLLARIRAISGFASFLQAPDLHRLAAQARSGPIIFPYTSPARCGALVLTGDPSAPAQAVPLTGLSEQDAVRQANRLLRARRDALGEETSRAERRAANEEICDVLAWMWDTITGPVMASLRLTGPPADGQPWPRVWWCPVGILAYLPLHAAGHHHDITAARPDPRAVLDRAVSSYTTTIRGLTYARAQQPDTHGDATLIIAAPAVPGTRNLDGVTAEAAMVTDLIPSAYLLPNPTAEAVLDALPRYPVAHFACHGYADWADPAASRLILPGSQPQTLTVADISALHLTSSLAYLSACDTTVTSPNLADEAIHITGAFHLAGYPHVIGTLWPLDDTTAETLARDIYRQLTNNGSISPDARNAAHALHHATRALRNQHPDRPALWAAHTHTGA